jgi:uncharacterized protein YndB with AHSA1/START domain
MSVKKEPSGRRSVQVEVEVPGTPEEVWEAIATGPGVSSWFVPTELRDDGTVVSHFGPGMDAVATQTVWDPPRKFAAEGELGPNAPRMATEWTLEARSGGTCIVRVVHSLFASTDDWDDQLGNIEGGWPDYFRILRLYLTHFRGQACSNLQFVQFSPGPVADAWTRLVGSLGLAGVTLGERTQSPEGAPALSGLVEAGDSAGHGHQFLLRLDEPTPGLAHLFAMPMGAMVCLVVRFYLYGDQAAAVARRDEPVWQAWLSERFPPAGPGPVTC